MQHPLFQSFAALFGQLGIAGVGGVQQALVFLHGKLGIHRQKDFPVVPAGQADDKDSRALRPMSKLRSYWAGERICSSSTDSCSSPKVPRTLTLVSTFLMSPTPRASPCISPRPL